MFFVCFKLFVAFFFGKGNVLQAKFLQRTNGEFNAKFVRSKRGKEQGKQEESSSEISNVSCSSDDSMVGTVDSLPILEPEVESLWCEQASPCLRSTPSFLTMDTDHVYLNHSYVNWPSPCPSATVAAPRGFDEVMGMNMAQMFPSSSFQALSQVEQPGTPEFSQKSCGSTLPDSDHEVDLISGLDDFLQETQKLLEEPMEQPVDSDMAFADTLAQEDMPAEIVNGSQTQVWFLFLYVYCVKTIDHPEHGTRTK